MGRVKLQIKKIENNTNRQVTFSKRRNGLIKKAYELSVLCDVEVALVLFSPSGRVSVFSGNKSIEDILTRYIDLPEHERGRLQNQEYLQRALGKLKYEADPMFQAVATSSPVSMVDAQVEDMQQEMFKCKCQLEDMEKKLRVYECNPAEIATLCEAEYREQALEENLKHVRQRKHFLQDHYNSASQVVNLASENADLNVLGSRHQDVDISEWLPQRSPQVQILNFLDSNGLLPPRDQPQRLDSMLPLTLVHAPTLNVYNHMSPGRSMEGDSHRPPFGQAIDVNLSPWADHLYPTGNNHLQPREHALELFLSQLTPGDQNHL